MHLLNGIFDEQLGHSLQVIFKYSFQEWKLKKLHLFCHSYMYNFM